MGLQLACSSASRRDSQCCLARGASVALSSLCMFSACKETSFVQVPRGPSEVWLAAQARAIHWRGRASPPFWGVVWPFTQASECRVPWLLRSDVISSRDPNQHPCQVHLRLMPALLSRSSRRFSWPDVAFSRTIRSGPRQGLSLVLRSRCRCRWRSIFSDGYRSPLTSCAFMSLFLLCSLLRDLERSKTDRA